MSNDIKFEDIHRNIIIHISNNIIRIRNKP